MIFLHFLYFIVHFLAVVYKLFIELINKVFALVKIILKLLITFTIAGITNIITFITISILISSR